MSVLGAVIMSKVVIGIQARTNNTRLPGKCQMEINGKTMLEWVIGAAQKSANYLNNGSWGIKVTVALLVPVSDPLIERYHRRRDLDLITGPELDVLSRYHMAMEQLKPDLMVRITSDCPLLPPFIISKHINIADKYNYDYVSNVNPTVRMAPDGWDCEVMSAEMLEWVNKTATKPEDREHVTTIIRDNPPKWAKIANVLGHAEFSHLKLSVDTNEDLEFVRTYQKICSDKIEKAKSKQFADGYYIL